MTMGHHVEVTELAPIGASILGMMSLGSVMAGPGGLWAVNLVFAATLGAVQWRSGADVMPLPNLTLWILTQGEIVLVPLMSDGVGADSYTVYRRRESKASRIEVKRLAAKGLMEQEEEGDRATRGVKLASQG